MKPYLIDAHQDIAYNALTFGRDYLRSAADTRQQERDTLTPQRTGQCLMGWPDYQRGRVAVIFTTLFLSPRKYAGGGPVDTWETQIYTNPQQARQGWETQWNYYRRLCDEHPDQFRLIFDQKDLREVLLPWETSEPIPPTVETADAAATSATHPIGLVLSMEGVEGLGAPEELEEWWQRGVRMVGPVWAGTRFCGGTFEPGGFTSEGYALLEVMAGLNMPLDISHMTERSALQALDTYPGAVFASHANARALIKNVQGERHLTDPVIHQLVDRGGVMGVLPYNRFLVPDWRDQDDRQFVTLRTLAAHIDHICQIAGDARHAGIGTDFDGGFGWPAVPYEIDTIADLPKLGMVLADYGYTEESIGDIFGNNWRRHLERTLPSA